MSLTVCFAVKSLYYPSGGGHLWAYLNWALGLRSQGCQVTWFEAYDPNTPSDQLLRLLDVLRSRLSPFGLADKLALWPWSGDLGKEVVDGCLGVDDAAAQADLLINQQYFMRADLVSRFRRTALLDIDPGLTQLWIGKGVNSMAPHNTYFTIGETVGREGSRFPDLGVRWHHVPPSVMLDQWLVHPSPDTAPFTTVSHWSMNEWEEDGGELYDNSKRAGFLPFLSLPRLTSVPLELAILLGDWDQTDRQALQAHGWRVANSHEVAGSPADYQRYVQDSRGEFSCAKPSCIRLQNAWISDRTLCYLASGKPAVVQHTGPSRFLPDSEGLFRFHDLEGATRSLEAATSDYERQGRLARALAEEYFDARKNAASLLERAL